MLKQLSTLSCISALCFLPINAKAFNLGDVGSALKTTVDIVEKVTKDDNSANSNSSSKSNNNSSSNSRSNVSNKSNSKSNSHVSSNKPAVSTNSSSKKSTNSAASTGLPDGRTALMDSIAIGDYNKYKELLAQGNIDINARDNKGQTVLHYAATGFGAQLKELLKLYPNAEINARDNEGYTPIMRAAANNSKRSIAYLAEVGADSSILPHGKTLEQVVQKWGDKENLIAMMQQSGEVVSMPRHYKIDATIMKHAKNVAKGFMGDSFVDVLFLESDLRPFKSTKWPHPITHYSMEVGLIAKSGKDYTMRKTDMQVYNGGANQSDIRFQSSMNRVSLTQKINYK